MAAPITLRFSLSEDDYRKAIRIVWLKRSWSRAFIALFIVLFLLSLISLIGTVGNPAAGSILVPIFGMVLSLAMISLPFSVLPRLAAKQARTRAALTAETTWFFSDQHVQSKNQHEESTFDATEYSGVTVNSEYYLLHPRANPNSVQIIPRRALEEPSQEEAFTKWLAEHVAGYKTRASRPS